VAQVLQRRGQVLRMQAKACVAEVDGAGLPAVEQQVPQVQVAVHPAMVLWAWPQGCARAQQALGGAGQQRMGAGGQPRVAGAVSAGPACQIGADGRLAGRQLPGRQQRGRASVHAGREFTHPVQVHRAQAAVQHAAGQPAQQHRMPRRRLGFGWPAVQQGAAVVNQDRKSTRLNSSHNSESRMPSSA
jgi:hypothetical protein